MHKKLQTQYKSKKHPDTYSEVECWTYDKECQGEDTWRKGWTLAEKSCRTEWTYAWTKWTYAPTKLTNETYFATYSFEKCCGRSY